MEENENSIESLLKKTVDYGETSFELVKLKTIEKTSDVISSLTPVILVSILISIFVLFLSIGTSFWLGEILGKMYFGFFAVAVFYLIIGLSFHLLLHKWFKKIIGNYIVKQCLKKDQCKI